MTKPTLNNDNGYGLRLANGQGWHIIWSEGARPWVEKLAAIMELQNGGTNGSPKRIFIGWETGKDGCGEPIRTLDRNMQEHLPRSGWTANNHRALQLWSHPDVPDVICEIGPKKDYDLDILRMWLSLHPIYTWAQESGGLPMHAALIERDGMGVLLSAPGNTGKSTCCRRLPPPWHVLCDDEALIVGYDQKQYQAHPFPTWSDYLWHRCERTWNVQQHIPLSAIFFMEQAEADDVVPIGQGEAAIWIYRSATQVCRRSWRNLNPDEEVALRKKVFDNACELAKVVPAFKLRVSLTGRFWQEVEKVLT